MTKPREAAARVNRQTVSAEAEKVRAAREFVDALPTPAEMLEVLQATGPSATPEDVARARARVRPPLQRMLDDFSATRKPRRWTEGWQKALWTIAAGIGVAFLFGWVL